MKAQPLNDHQRYSGEKHNASSNPSNLYFPFNLMNFIFYKQESINDEDDDWWMAVERTASQAELTHFN